MAINPSSAPDEVPLVLSSERSWLQGAIVSSIAYGIIVCLYFLTLDLLRAKNRVEFKNRLPLFIYITVVFTLGTLYTISLAGFTQMAFIDNRNFPGGPSAYEVFMSSAPMDVVNNVVMVLSNWLCDALVVWRFKMIYQLCRAPMWSLMLFPCLMLAGSVAMGIMFLISISTMNLDMLIAYYAETASVPIYLTISLGLNIILTIAIVLRLLILRHNVIAVLGQKHGKHYLSIAAMIVESAALYATTSITFFVLLGIGNPVLAVFIQVLCPLQILTTLLILFRVAQGHGWNDDTATRVMSDIQFASPGVLVIESGEVVPVAHDQGH